MANRKKNRSPQKLPALPRRELLARLSEAEATLRAIRSGEVDAIVVNGPGGEKVFTLQGADHTYRVFVERMNEGAAVLSGDHTVLHCNRCFARFLGARLQSVIGSSMQDLVWPDDHARLNALLRLRGPKELPGRDPFAIAKRPPFARPSLLESSPPGRHAGCLLDRCRTCPRRSAPSRSCVLPASSCEVWRRTC